MTSAAAALRPGALATAAPVKRAGPPVVVVGTYMDSMVEVPEAFVDVAGTAVVVAAYVGAWIWPSLICEMTVTLEAALEVLEVVTGLTTDPAADVEADPVVALAEEPAAETEVVTGAWIWPSLICEMTVALEAALVDLEVVIGLATEPLLDLAEEPAAEAEEVAGAWI